MVRAPSVAVGVALLALTTPARADDDEPPPLRLEVVAELGRPWKMVVTNVSKIDLRVPADARLLSLEVVPAPKAEDFDPKKKHKPKAYVRGKMPVCRVPADMRAPEVGSDRMVVLKPGQRYVEVFDPMAICGTSKVGDTLGPGALVYPSYGYAPRKKDDDKPPFVAEPIHAADDDEDAWKQILAPPVFLNRPPEAPAAPGAADDDDEDDRRPRVEVTTQERVDSQSSSDLTVRATIKNVGERAALLHLRQDDLQFVVGTPGGFQILCRLGPQPRGAVPDFFETWRPGRSRSYTTRLREVCPNGTFDRPGVYTAHASVFLRQTGDPQHLTAFVTTADAEHDTKIRVRKGKLPYHAAPPRVLGPDEDDEGRSLKPQAEAAR